MNNKNSLHFHHYPNFYDFFFKSDSCLYWYFLEKLSQEFAIYTSRGEKTVSIPHVVFRCIHASLLNQGLSVRRSVHGRSCVFFKSRKLTDLTNLSAILSYSFTSDASLFEQTCLKLLHHGSNVIKRIKLR